MKLHLPTILFAASIVVALSACSTKPKEESKQKVQLIFETDMGNDVDDALALDMIFKYVEDGDADLLAISTNKAEVESAEYLDILKTWYGYPDIPLGRVRDGVDLHCDFPFARRAADLKNPDGTPKYERTHINYAQLPESYKLYRQVLSQAADTSVVIASVGYTTNLARLLDSPADEYSELCGRDLVAKKVKLLSIMGCFLSDTVTLEFNVTVDKESSKKVFKDWPTKMVYSPAELGLQVWYPGTQMDKDFYWANGAHPMVDGYKNYFCESYDRPCWDLTSVLYAVEGGSYYNISDPGNITMNEKGVTTFTPDENGLAYVISATDEQAEVLKDRFVELTHRIPKHYLEQYPYKNPALSAEERAADLLPRLTLEQKVSLMQNDSPEIRELGIKKYNWWSEALHGVAANGIATVFPQNTGLAASFDPQLVQSCFEMTSTEARVKFTEQREKGQTGIFQGLTFWAPNVNLFRDPRWGRGQETYGEDPYLISIMGKAAVNGLQGDTRGEGYDKLHCCLKHYAVHSGPESRRHNINIEDLSYRDLRETYLAAFEYLVKNTDVKEVMCAYNAVDGKPCCGNDRLLTLILRNEWGYKGIVLSDCGAINDFFSKGTHNLFPDDPQGASASAVSSGTDLECGNAYANLVEAVRIGKIEEKTLDVSLMRLLTARFELGEMDPEESVNWNRIPHDTLVCEAHHNAARQMALESMTLLKNNGILPLAKEGLKVAVIGPNAADERVLWGNYHGVPDSTVTVLDGICSKLGKENVSYCKYCCIVDDFTYNADCPAFDFVSDSSAKDSSRYPSLSKAQIDKGDFDAYIFVGGIASYLESEEGLITVDGFHKGDRTNIELPKVQREALKDLKAKGKPVIFVNMSGGAMGLVPEMETCDAILQAWYPGQAGGDAVADVLFGDYNPSGKLPVTFYRSIEDVPDFEDYDMAGRTYRYFDGEPLFPFGYGLSYTKFETGEAKLMKGSRDVRKFSASSKLDLVVPVSNVGDMDGNETIQVYIRRDEDVNGPRMSLRGFDKVFAPKGETVEAHIALDGSSFCFFNEENGLTEAVKGDYTIFYGTSSDAKDLKEIKITLR